MAELPRSETARQRGRLGFGVAVSESFRFLLDRGFELRELSDTYARYESDRRLVRVFHGRSSYELGVEVGRWIVVDGVRREQIFPLRDIVSLAVDPASVGYGGTSATAAETVRKFTGQLAGWTQQFASGLLDNGDEVFEQLCERNASLGETSRDAQRATLIRSRADAAWRERDFATVINAYKEIDLELTGVELRPSERGRLEYALRALND
jgi:hypothetical protein